MPNPDKQSATRKLQPPLLVAVVLVLIALPWLLPYHPVLAALASVAALLVLLVAIRLGRLPAPEPQPAAAPLPARTLPADPLPPPAPLTIDSLVLVVDDSLQNRIVCAAQLAKHFRHVATAESGEQALALFDRDHPDALVLDLHMPGLSGLDVIEKIRAQERRHDDSPTRLVVLTADGSAVAHARCMAAGADAVLVKPAHTADLLTALQLQTGLQAAS